MATEIGYSVPAGSLEFWADRFKANNVTHGPIAERFGEQYLPFEDPDGLKLNLIVPKTADNRQAWELRSDGVYVQRNPGDEAERATHRLLLRDPWGMEVAERMMLRTPEAQRAAETRT